MSTQTKKSGATKAAPEKNEQQPRPAELELKAKIQKLIDNPESKVKAIASVAIGGEFAIHGLKVVDSDKGLFVSMPNDKWTDSDGVTKYKDTFHAITAEARTNLIETVMEAYGQELAQAQTEAPGGMAMQ